MAADLHCHTKKTKSFESESRNVEINLFREKVEEAEVKMLGITNHNYFNNSPKYLKLDKILQKKGKISFPVSVLYIFLIF